MTFAKQVRDGESLQCNAVIDCVKRFFHDIDRMESEDCPFYFDPDKAERYLRLVQRFKHVKGANWNSPYILYEPWQCFLFMYLMGFMSKLTTRRRFRTAYVQIPRGQGKSVLASQAGLYFVSLEKEEGPEVICASTKKDAARIVFDSSRFMALKNESYLKATGTKVLAHTINHPSTNGIMKPISSDSKSLDGLNPSLILGDETHEWNRKLYDVLDSSLTKRDDSLFFMISTAGLSTDSIGHELYSYSKKVLSQEIEDDTWFSMIFEMDDGDDWESPEVWRKVNPNWGVSIDPVNFEAKAKKAKETPAARYNFLVKHLNKWQNTASPFFNLDYFDKCARKIKIEDFYGERCYVGLDLASKIDLCSIVYMFKKDGHYYFFDKTYLPEARLWDGKNRNYQKYVDKKEIELMTGEVNNFGKIQNLLIKDASRFKITALHADPWSANETIQKLSQEGLNAVEFRMNTANLSEPMKKVDALMREGKIHHNGSSMLKWVFGNVVAKEDHNSNYYPRKENESSKIDPVISVIMAMAGWINEIEEEESVYEERGFISF